MSRDYDRDDRDRNDRDDDRRDRDRDRDDDRRDREERYDDRPRRYDRDDEPLSRDELKRKVKLPAVFLIIVGVLYLGFSVWGVVYTAMFFDQQMEEAMAQQQAQQQAGTPQQKQAAQASQDMMKNIMPAMKYGSMALAGLFALLAVTIIFGASKMLTASNRGWGMAAAIIAMLPLQCYVWPFGIGIGIWAIVVLNNTQVRAAFAAGNSGRDREDDDRRDRE